MNQTAFSKDSLVLQVRWTFVKFLNKYYGEQQAPAVKHIFAILILFYLSSKQAPAVHSSFDHLILNYEHIFLEQDAQNENRSTGGYRPVNDFGYLARWKLHHILFSQQTFATAIDTTCLLRPTAEVPSILKLLLSAANGRST